MHLLKPEIIFYRAKTFAAVCELQKKKCMSERQSLFYIYQRYKNLSINSGFYGTAEQAYFQYKKFKREVKKILKNKKIPAKFWV